MIVSVEVSIHPSILYGAPVATPELMRTASRLISQAYSKYASPSNSVPTLAIADECDNPDKHTCILLYFSILLIGEPKKKIPMSKIMDILVADAEEAVLSELSRKDAARLKVTILGFPDVSNARACTFTGSRKA